MPTARLSMRKIRELQCPDSRPEPDRLGTYETISRAYHRMSEIGPARPSSISAPSTTKQLPRKSAESSGFLSFCQYLRRDKETGPDVVYRLHDCREGDRYDQGWRIRCRKPEMTTYEPAYQVSESTGHSRTIQ